MNDQAMRRIALDGATIEYSDCGAGEALLLIHAGVFGAWFAPLQQLSPPGFRTIRMLRAGYTDAPTPDRHLTIVDHARHAGLLLDILGIGHAHVLAHSSGCLIALQLTVDRPALVDSLTLSEPSIGGGLTPASFGTIGDTVIGPAVSAAMAGDIPTAFDTFMRGVCADDFRTTMIASLGAESIERALRDAHYFFTDEMPAVAEWTFSATEAAPITTPVLVVLGGASPPAVHDIGTLLVSMVPHAETLTIPGGDHLLPLRRPAELARIATNFARRSSSQNATSRRAPTVVDSVAAGDALTHRVDASTAAIAASLGGPVPPISEG
jgi:pimeloyl-ACP methyl ester carboxylesterase